MAQPVAGCGLLFDDLFPADFLSDVVCDHEWTAGLPLHSAEESNLQERHDQPAGNLILEDDCQLDLMLDAVCDIEGNRLFDQHDDGLPSQSKPATTKRDTEWPLLQYSGQPTQPVKTSKGKSQVAQEREKVAKQAFDTLRKSVERASLENGPSTTQTFDLLTPDMHLTEACWKDFRTYVDAHAGWRASRREATPEERTAYLALPQRKFKAYFVSTRFSTSRSILEHSAERSSMLAEQSHPQNLPDGRQADKDELPLHFDMAEPLFEASFGLYRW